jgi:hypothetical protein
MRAKLQISQITKFQSGNEQLKFHGVPAAVYKPDGMDEDNTYAKFSPSVELSITIANPALLGKFAPGDKFYVDFTPVPVAVPAPAPAEVPVAAPAPAPVEAAPADPVIPVTPPALP